MFSLDRSIHVPTTIVLVLFLTGCTSEPPSEPPGESPDEPTSDTALVERGAYLVEGIAGCGNCHTPRDEQGALIEDMNLAGAFVIEEPEFTAYAPNITPHEATGIGGWTEAETIRAIREGIHPDGHILGPPMSFVFYRRISDRDIQSIVAYLRTVPAINNVVPRTEFNIPLPESWGPPLEQVADVSPEDEVAYGAYLAGPVGHCIDCHTPLVEGQLVLERVGAGGNVYPRPFGFEFTTSSSNITQDVELGIGAWTDEEIKRAITEGVSRNGRQLLPFMGFSFYQNIGEEDLDAIVAYLKTLDPVEND